MSHFAVLVIGNNIEQQLQPYHEFECTGTDDQYVQDVDITEEKRAEFADATRSMIRCPNGELVYRYDDRFYRDPTEAEQNEIGTVGGTGSCNGSHYTSKYWGDGRGYRPKVHFIPEGHEAVDVPFESFRDYLADYCSIAELSIDNPLDMEKTHKYGYARIVNGEVEKVIYRTNPNKKWDWWEVGGRWSGFLKLKNGATGTLGRRGLMGACADDGPGRADAARKGDIDFDGMRDASGTKAAERWDKAAAARGDATWHSWEHVRHVLHPGNISAARDAYHAQPAAKAVSKALDNPWDGVDEYLVPRDQYIQQARDQATVLYALVKDGKWIARGDMGWFGMSNDHGSQDDWNRKVNELLGALPDDTLITVVDCHI
ncbi:hypothetical protein [Burkholderia ubonensis]|uniref:hypothetical protein n=1 Tax=Burkholderia ubonensis TaxID=101571 RepID=UPI0007586912|nr:hypothetical protein [Burkholderia ubonensis]KVP48434.1 hypothetical protein WJ90_15145 [Burkholderia ubonensis]